MGKDGRNRRKDKKRNDERRSAERFRRRSATSVENIEKFQRQYVLEWSGSAQAFDQSGHYAWMASLLEDFVTVVEIGIGDGRSTRALAGAGHAVIALEENPFCIDAAKATLDAAGIPCTAVLRGTRDINEARHEFFVSYARVASPRPAPGTVLILESDVISDPLLEAWLIQTGTIDAVACWLIGTHAGQQRNAPYVRDQVFSVPEYRLRVHRAAYEFAGRVLRTDGVLQIVERAHIAPGDARASELRQALRGHQHLAQQSQMEPWQQDQRAYEEPEAGGMRMMSTLRSSAQIETLDQRTLELVSTISRKFATLAR